MKLMVIDGNSIINRAYYGIRPLTTREGLYTHAVFGFLTTMLRLVGEESPDAPLMFMRPPSGTLLMRPTRLPASPCRRSFGCRCRCSRRYWTR